MTDSNKSYDLVLVLRCKVVKKLHIGNDPSIKITADLQLSRIGSNIIIPATTIKGVLRSCIIRIASLFNYEIKNNSIHPEKIKEDDIVTSLLGKPHGYRSKIIIEPVVLNNVQSIILPHVSIDDKLMIAEENAFFNVEYIATTTEFNIKLNSNRLTIDEARLLFLAIKEMSYERFGRGGMIEVNIDIGKSSIPEDIKNDEIIKEVLG